MIDVQRIVEMQTDTVARWHHEPLDNPHADWMSIVCQQHQYNYQLWHQEDIARSPDVSDAKIANVKRAIDRFNQQRNDWIERIDDWLTEYLASQQIRSRDDARLNTETPGSAVDRLSILALRIYHLREQLERTDVEPSHLEKVNRRLEVCLVQQRDLANSLEELLSDMLAGVKRHRTYRQFKMYNDPTLNPYLYNRQNSGS